MVLRIFGSTGHVIVGTNSGIQEKSQMTDRADRLNRLSVGWGAGYKGIGTSVGIVPNVDVLTFGRVEN